MTFDPIKDPTYTEKQRLEVLRDTIPYKKVRATFDLLCEIIDRTGIQPAKYNDMQPATHIIHSVQVYATNVTAQVRFSDSLHDSTYRELANAHEKSTWGQHVFGWFGVEDGWLTLHISSLDYPNKKEEEKEVEVQTN